MSKKGMKRVFRTGLDDYIEQQQLGEGGCGRVFAVETPDGEQFALKLLRADANHGKRKRFKREIQFCQRTQHKNIVPIVDTGYVEVDGVAAPFYVMPRYPATLRSRMKAGLPPEEALRLMEGVLDGVEAAHLKGVVHRDLKPENILCAEAAVISDFGVAHFLEADLYTVVETKPGEKLANANYAAPEQRERGATVDSRADIFAIGLMLNEVLTGRVPLGSDYLRAAEVHARWHELDEVVAQMIRQDPSKRPADIASVKALLSRAELIAAATQRLDADQGQVIAVNPDADLEPVAVLGPIDWKDEQLVLRLSRQPVDRWIMLLRSGNFDHSALMGRGPQSATVVGDQLRVRAKENEIADQIKHASGWARSTSHKFSQILNQEREELRRAEEQRKSRERKAEEQRLRVLRSLELVR